MPITQRSAVLAALFEEDGEAQVVSDPSGDVAAFPPRRDRLPGGRCDPDETPVQTALREAREEVGLEPSTVTPFAWLSPIVTFASGSSIWPIVGELAGRPDVHASRPAEVERAFTVALSRPRGRRSVPRRAVASPRGASRRGDEDGYFPIYFFRVPGELIWGATARVVAELLAVVTGAQRPLGSD